MQFPQYPVSKRKHQLTQQTRVFTVEPRPVFKDKDVWHLEVRSSSNSDLLAFFFFF